MADRTVRCDVDDVVFQSMDGTFPNNGHSDCPGPECRKKYEAVQTPAQKAAIAAARAETAQRAAEAAAAIAKQHLAEATRLQKLASAESDTEAVIAAAAPSGVVAPAASPSALEQVLAGK